MGKLRDWFTEEAREEEPAWVKRVANVVVINSFGREGEAEFGQRYAPNWKLRVANLVIGLVQLVTAVIIFGITDSDARWPWYTFFPFNLDPEENREQFSVPDPHRVGNIPVGYYSGIFLFLSFLDHLLVSLPCGPWQVYRYWVSRNQNHFRWLEYSLSASLMHVMIAQVSGVTDVHLLFAIFGLTAATMFYGALHEILNASRFGKDSKQVPRTWFAFVAGCVPHTFAWLVIVCYFFQAVSNAEEVPGFVWAIIFILFFTDALFAVALWLQWLEVWIWRDYVGGELTFMLLSLTSKQLLAWINFGGSQRA
ncbi:Heliorhodopsin [Balamuthia mandrillaris]